MQLIRSLVDQVGGPSGPSVETVKHFEESVAELPEKELESFVYIAGALFSDQQNNRSGRQLGQVFVELKEDQTVFQHVFQFRPYFQLFQQN